MEKRNSVIHLSTDERTLPDFNQTTAVTALLPQNE